MPTAEPLVSIIISNYDYAHFLPEAIESALKQTYRRIEVIVVDDGSSDHSREIIESYGDRIIGIFQENGGQGSAFNTGFAASKGALISFLDPDDLFLPEKVSSVVDTWKANPDAYVVYNQLRAIDAWGNDLFSGKAWPNVMLNGEIGEHVDQTGGWWPCPTTSGLSFARSYLDRVMPIPEDEFRRCADAYVAGLAPFLGPVAGIAKPLTLYRIHGENYWQLNNRDKPSYRRKVERYDLEFSIVKETLEVRFGVKTDISLEDHYLYQYFARNSGEDIPLHRVLSIILRCPLLPTHAKVRETARALLNRA